MTHEELEATLVAAATAESVGNYDESVRLATQVLEATDSHAANEAALHTKALYQLGAIERLRGNWAEAFELYSTGLKQSEGRSDRAAIGTALNNLGIIHRSLNEYDKAMDFYSRALAIAEELGKPDAVASCLSNIGNLYSNLSDYPKAIEYNTKALSIVEEQGNKQLIAAFHGNLGSMYSELSDFSKALEHDAKALSVAQDLGNRALMATTMGNIGLVYYYLADYSKALEYYTTALSIDEDLGNKMGVARCLGNLGNLYMSLSDLPKALEYLEKARSIGEELGNDVGLSYWLGNIGGVHMELSDYSKAIEYYTKALEICKTLGRKEGVAIWMTNIGEVYARQQKFDSALEYFSRGLELLDELGIRIYLGEVKSKMGGLYANTEWRNYEPVKAEKYLLEAVAISEEVGSKRYQTYKELANLYERQQRWQEFAFHLKKYCELKDEVQNEEAKKSAIRLEQNRQIAEREKEIALAKAISDAKMSATTNLLYKVLPESVATRMIDGEAEIADYYTSVSILFADIAGFTPISADMPAIVVVRFLNYVFGEFDRIIKKHGCEKIKTIGDGYMAVCGAPVECADHAERLASAALEMQQTISLPESIAEFMPSGVEFGIRIGLHTGSVVAGVIGEERFVYDIYSDAVNTAARMESHGEENRIHCSNDFYRHLQNRFAMTKNTNHGFVFEKRGEMEIKGKGMMRTYFLEKV